MAEARGIEARLDRAWRELLELVSESTGTSPLALSPERRMALSRTALFAQLEEVREDFRALRDLVDEEVASRFVNASWTLKDLLAHLASWAREFRFEVETALRNESFDYAIPFAFSVMGPTQWNAKEVQARKEKSLAAVFDELEEETVRLQELLPAMEDSDPYRAAELPLSPSGDPDQRWRGPIGFIIAGKCMHDRHHIDQIRERLKRFRQ